jgi:peptidoglycan/xylan/chitin deacetylase (PgdA/CDA1 family)
MLQKHKDSNVYSKLRASLSIKNQGYLTKLLVKSGIKPTCNKTTRSPFEKGIIIFSADFEMAWAFRFSKTKFKESNEKGLKERKNVPILLDLFQKYSISVTWAIIGHLFLNQCKRDANMLAHPEMPRPIFFENQNWSFYSGDWYSHDPCTDFINDPAWYAPDLIDQILGSKNNHEIGCHTFSHIDFSYKNCPKTLADAELDACLKAATMKNVKLKSMVFPGGTFGNFESLKKKGFICYRKPMKFHIDLPSVDSYGLVAIPSSLGLDRDQYGWSKEFHLKMIHNYLAKASKYKCVCHFWFHPSMNEWYLENVIPEVLKMVAQFRDSDKIHVKTMGQLAEEVLNLKN